MVEQVQDQFDTQTPEIEPQVRNVVRIIPIQPVNTTNLREQLDWIQDPAAINLTEIFLIQKNDNAQNARQVMFAGGRQKPGESTIETALGQFSDELDAHAINNLGVLPLGSMHYSFMYRQPDGTTVQRCNNQAFCVVPTPPNIYMNPLYSRDKIKRVISFNAQHLKQFLTTGKIEYFDGKNQETLHLIDNLLLDEDERGKRNVFTDQVQLEQIHESILANARIHEYRYKALLTWELACMRDDKESIYWQAHAESILKQAFSLNAYSVSPKLEESLLHNYQSFMRNYTSYYPNNTNDFIVSAWERVLTKINVRHAAELPFYQANMLVAQIDPEPTYDLNGYFSSELDIGEKKRLAIALKFSEFAMQAVTFGAFRDKPKSSDELINRLREFRDLKITSLQEHVNANYILDWEQHVRQAYCKIFNIDPRYLYDLNEEYNDAITELHEEYARNMASSDITPSQVAHDDMVGTIDLAQLLCMSYDIDPRKSDQCLSINSRVPFEARRKLIRIATMHDPYIHRKEYIERARLLPFVHIIESIIIRDDYLATERYIGDKKCVFYPTRMGVNENGEWTVVNDDCEKMPDGFRRISIAYNQRDKKFRSYMRKLEERGWRSEQIKDMFGVEIIINESESSPWSNHAARALKDYFTSSAQKLWGNSYCEDERETKDRLDDGKKTGGSAASKGGYRWLKWCPELSLNEGTLVAEFAIYSSINDKEIKSLDDLRYRLERLLVSRNGLMSVMLLWLDPTLYPDEYTDISGWLRRQEENNKKSIYN